MINIVSIITVSMLAFSSNAAFESIVDRKVLAAQLEKSTRKMIPL